MKVLDGEETLKKSRGSFSRNLFSIPRSLGVLICLTPPSKLYCDRLSPGWLRTGPVKVGAREASSFWSVELSSFNKLKWYASSESVYMVIIQFSKQPFGKKRKRELGKTTHLDFPYTAIPAFWGWFVENSCGLSLSTVSIYTTIFIQIDFLRLPIAFMRNCGVCMCVSGFARLGGFTSASGGEKIPAWLSLVVTNLRSNTWSLWAN